MVADDVDDYECGLRKIIFFLLAHEETIRNYVGNTPYELFVQRS